MEEHRYALEMRQAEILRKSSGSGWARIQKFLLFYSSLNGKYIKKKLFFSMRNLLLIRKENIL